MTANKLSRRDLFLRSKNSSDQDAHRIAPPWTSRQRLAENCTGCGDCVDACPEEIISIGSDGLPALSFSETGCTFCRLCAMACEEPVFASFDTRPFPHRISVSEGCLSKSGVACQSCADVCPSGALKYDLSIRPVGGVVLKSADCTGCGMCQSVCPASALESLPDLASSDRTAT